MTEEKQFDELVFFAQVKRRPGAFFGRKSLIGLRDMLCGMQFAFAVCGEKDALRYSEEFIEKYNRRLMEKDSNGYSCWWNYLLYISGNDDDLALDNFFRAFEGFLEEEYGLKLLEVR